MKTDKFPFRALKPLCMRILKFLGKLGIHDFPVKKESLERLCVGTDAKEAQEEQACRCIGYMLIIAFVTAMFAVSALIGGRAFVNEGRLPRNAAGEGGTSYELELERDGREPGQIQVNVSEQRYEGNELERFFEGAFESLEKAVLGENTDAENVCEKLDLVKEIGDSRIKVTWPELDSTYFYPTGNIVYEAVNEPVVVCLTAVLEYYDEVRIHSFPIRLVPKRKNAAELFEENLEKLLREEDRISADSPWFNLPTVVEGEEIGWAEKSGTKHIWIILLGLGAICAVIPAMRSEIAGREKEREEEMMRDYPDIITKFVLLVTAGMTCRSAWEKICTDYAKGAGRKRFAYEEMLRTAHELRFGAGEAKAYEDFGKRCGVAAYRKFGVLLANNLKRGSRDLTGVLEQEATAALEARTARARVKAGEAGTKLLLPMFGMLCLVFAIIMVPAFSSFGG